MSISTHRPILLLFFLLTVSNLHSAEPNDSARYFEIHVVDADTGRGVPLVELTTVDQVTYVTDNAGRVAYFEPGHAGQVIYFTVKSQGYETTKDGFGFPGVRLTIQPGGSETIKLKRINLAERLYRITGQGLYRDTVLLGKDAPLKQPLGAGMVAGQDSVAALPYLGKIWWFWGDTLRLSYPLGHFRMAGATTKLGDEFDPSLGIDYDYFVDKDGFSRPMAEIPDQPGVVWLDGFATVPGETGEEVMVAHFSRRPGLADAYEQGMMRFNDKRGVFEKATNVPLDATWTFLHVHPVEVKEGNTTYLVCGGPFLVTRVKRTLADVLNPDAYESWSCMDEKGQPRRTKEGHLDYRWQKTAPVTQQVEQGWLKKGVIKPEEIRYLPVDSKDPRRRVVMHNGSTRWNEHLKRWVMIAIEAAQDKTAPSYLGEVWYSESPSPQGPWTTAVKIVTHDKQSFYNPCHHAFFDQSGGKTIYFEGTYCNTFTDSPPTQRYNYNQIMYRLDVDHPEVAKVFGR